MTGNAWGLAADGWTWLVAAVLAVAWAVSVGLCPSWARNRWRAVPTSLFGFVWLGFGITFVLRFVVLSIDSFTFGNLTDRLAARPVGVVNETLLLAGGFWLCLCAGMLAARRRRGAGPLGGLAFLEESGAARATGPLALISSACLIASSGFVELPVALLTPLAVLGRLWVIPAAIVWWRSFRSPRPGDRVSRWLYLFPGVLLAALSPYRQHLVTTGIVPVVAALFAGRRLRGGVVAAGGLAFVLAVTVVIDAARMLMWEARSPGDVAEQLSWRAWVEHPETAPWIELLRRFHGFDSLLLTIDLVPSAMPHSRREVFLSPVLRGLIPRALYPEKEASARGFEFSTSIWADDELASSPAAIAPSMPGDLYEAGGLPYVLLGGFLWGALVGACDAWRRRLPAGAGAGVTVLFALPFGASLETDYAHTVATVIQTLLVIGLVGLVRFARRLALRPALARPPVPGAVSICTRGSSLR